METKDITPLQYAEYKGCTLANITKHIRNGNALKMPYVRSLKNWGRFYLLEVPKNLTSASFSKELIRYSKH